MITPKMSSNKTPERYAAQELVEFSAGLLQRTGLSEQRALTVAEILVEADLMGHSTHGMQLLAPYLQQLEAGSMTKEGFPMMIADHGSAITWDGQYLPGPWLVTQALDVAFERIHHHPVVTVAIQRSHHIACLAAYPKLATDKGLLMLLATSDPNDKTVAPYGGIESVYSPNPLAVGIPTHGDPIIIDISTSSTANGLVGRYHNEKRRLPGHWLLDHQGELSDDPAVMFADPPGSMLPLGGTDLGYKGFALGLLIETLTSALAGKGRSDAPHRWGASVFLQVIDPDAFGGRAAFIQETEWLAEACRTTQTKPDNPPVRLPGGRALRLRTEQIEQGILLYPTILPTLRPWSEKLEVAMPIPQPPNLTHPI